MSKLVKESKFNKLKLELFHGICNFLPLAFFDNFTLKASLIVWYISWINNWYVEFIRETLKLLQIFKISGFFNSYLEITDIHITYLYHFFRYYCNLDYVLLTLYFFYIKCFSKIHLFLLLSLEIIKYNLFLLYFNVDVLMNLLPIIPVIIKPIFIFKTDHLIINDKFILIFE